MGTGDDLRTWWERYRGRSEKQKQTTTMWWLFTGLAVNATLSWHEGWFVWTAVVGLAALVVAVVICVDYYGRPGGR
ncbi:hypothetical protein [Streptosporangium sp. NPDC051022]|uniref:hypothetical protein n=1 Tax=Streptosporangium sp. NPDC051022 TaxID=3155752 RepID=UPI00342B888D